jgi:Peptidase U49
MKSSVESSPENTMMMTMIGAVPEREAEIRSLWQTYNPNVIVVNCDRFTLDATRERIKIDVKAPDIFWLVGFCGWHAIEAYTPDVICSAATGTPVADIMRVDNGLADVERDYKERIAAARSFITAANVTETQWPPDIPRPSSDRYALDNDQYKAAFDLTTSATAFILFHEFYHVILDKDCKRPHDRREEELACDVWAREFMTIKLEAYAKAHGFDYHQVLQRRAMAFVLAALILHEITPEWNAAVTLVISRLAPACRRSSTAPRCQKTATSGILQLHCSLASAASNTLRSTRAP